MPRLESVTEQRQQNSSIVSIGGAHVSVNVQQCVTQFVHNKGVFNVAVQILIVEFDWTICFCVKTPLRTYCEQ